MRIAAGYVDDKIVLARELLRAGLTMAEMAPALGYKNRSSVSYYLRRMGVDLPSVNKPRYKPEYSDDEKQVRSEKMKAWHANRRLKGA